MEYKSTLIEKICNYRFTTKYYHYDITRAEKLFKKNAVLNCYSPSYNKIIVEFENDKYMYIYVGYTVNYYSNIVNNVSIYFLCSLFYIRENALQLDEIVSKETVELKHDANNLITNVKRLFSDKYVIYPELDKKFCKYIDDYISLNNLEPENISTILSLFSKINHKENEKVKKYTTTLLLSLLNLSEEKISEVLINLKEEANIDSLCSIISSNLKQDNMLKVLILILDIDKKYNINAFYEKLINSYIIYNLSTGNLDKFNELSINNLNILSVKKYYFNYLFLEEKYEEIIKYYNDDQDKVIKNIYSKALLNTGGNISLDEIFQNGLSLDIIKELISKNKISKFEEIEKYINSFTTDDKRSVYILFKEYEKLFYDCKRESFDAVMNYCDELYTNLINLFIPYVENTMKNALSQRNRLNQYTKNLKKLIHLPCGKIYLINLLVNLDNEGYLMNTDYPAYNSIMDDCY